MKKYLLFLLLAISAIIKAQDCSSTTQYILGTRFYIDIPNCLEMQFGMYKQLSENFQKEIGTDISSDRVVFQNSGTNDFQKPSFVRVIYNNHYFGPGELKRLGTAFTQSEMVAQSKVSLEEIKGVSSNKILTWDKPVNVKIGNLNAAKQTYTRQLSGQPPVTASIYYIQDYDRIHMISLSYRIEEAEKWRPIMTKIILSLKTQ